MLVFPLFLPLAPLILLGLIRRRRFYRLRAERYQQRYAEHKDEGFFDDSSDRSLAVRAQRYLDEIRWQQSYSSGWGGSLRLAPVTPIAAEARADNGVALARNQLSLPEIIKHYEEFLKLAHRDYLVIVEIDELDKLESDETVRRFMNEIKALFGLEGCFYLLSVSESAMSSFERRGLPFRDVFDSSFDAIVYVDYLTLRQARRLLRWRVIGMPLSFLDFCYCMAGGLARDLVRTCRDLFGVRQTRNANKLSELCSHMIRADLQAKLCAVSIAAKDNVVGREVDQLFDKMRQLELTIASPHDLSRNRPYLLATCKDLLSSFNEESTLTPQKRFFSVFAELLRPAQHASLDGSAEQRDSLTALSTELGIYIYYCTTLLQFFTEDYNATTLQNAADSGQLDQLARARQPLSGNPRIAEAAIANVRKSYGMELI